MEIDKIDFLYIDGMPPIDLDRLVGFKQEFNVLFALFADDPRNRQKWESIPNDIIINFADLNPFTFADSIGKYLVKFPKYEEYIFPVLRYQHNKNKTYNLF